MNSKLGAIALFAALSCGAALAQNPFAGQTPVKAELKKAVSSKDKVGAEFSASTTQDITLGTMKLPRGTVLLGHVVSVTTHSKETPDGSLTVIFDHAKPKKGDPFAITASVYQIMPSDDSMQRADTAAGMRGTQGEQMNAAATRESIDANSKILPALVSPSSAPIKVVSAIPGVAISAVVSPEKSGIFVSKNSDVFLIAGYNMVIGVALATN